MSPWEEPYEPDDEQPAPRPPADEISRALGAAWYAQNHTIPECRRTFPGSAIVAHPETFDRFYLRSEYGPILVDILVGDRTTHEIQAARKRVEFKRDWCEQHGCRYLVLTEDDLSVGKIHALLDTPSPPGPVGVAPAPRARGGIQRPKATA